jgi:phosphatidate phosphatase PAH1
VLVEIYRNRINIDFALNYYKGVAREFGVFIEIRHDYQGDNLQPIKTFALERHSKRYPVTSKLEVGWEPNELENALEWFSSGQQECSSSQLQQNDLKKEQLQSHLQLTKNELNQLQLQLQHAQVELQQAQDTIKAMQTSKFWKLRTAWFNLKRLIGSVPDNT